MPRRNISSITPNTSNQQTIIVGQNIHRHETEPVSNKITGAELQDAVHNSNTDQSKRRKSVKIENNQPQKE